MECGGFTGCVGYIEFTDFMEPPKIPPVLGSIGSMGFTGSRDSWGPKTSRGPPVSVGILAAWSNFRCMASEISALSAPFIPQFPGRGRFPQKTKGGNHCYRRSRTLSNFLPHCYQRIVTLALLPSVHFNPHIVTIRTLRIVTLALLPTRGEPFTH